MSIAFLDSRGRSTVFEGEVEAASLAFELPFQVAFQPVVNVAGQRVVAYEALIRGSEGQSYPSLIENLDVAGVRRFHHQTAAGIIQRAVELGIGRTDACLCINLLPDLSPEALDADFIREAARCHGLPVEKIIIELTEDHKLTMPELHKVLDHNKSCGFVTAMDDFGAGYAGLTALVDCCPDVLKFDRALIRGIDSSPTRQKIVWAFVRVCNSLHLTLIAEGVETAAEMRMLRQLGIKHMQGYYFSRPVYDRLPDARDCGLCTPSAQRRQHDDAGSSWLARRLHNANGTLRAKTA